MDFCDYSRSAYGREMRTKISPLRILPLVLAITPFIIYFTRNHSAIEFGRNSRVGGQKPALPSSLCPDISRKSAQPAKEKMKTAQGNTGPNQPRCFRLLFIVIFNRPGHYGNLRFLKNHYGTAFEHMVFYGPPPIPACGEVFESKNQLGTFQHKTVLQAIDENPNYDGYLWIGDDVWLNYPQLLAIMDFNKIWLNAKNLTYFLDDKKPNPGPKTQTLFGWREWFGMPNVRKNYHKIPEKFRSRTEYAFGAPGMVLQSFSDVVYVPRRFVADLKTIAEAMGDVIFELVVPTALNLAATSRKEDIQYFRDAVYLWYGDRYRLHEFWNVNCSFIHAVKWSDITKQNMAKQWMAQSIEHYNYTGLDKRFC